MTPGQSANKMPTTPTRPSATTLKCVSNVCLNAEQMRRREIVTNICASIPHITAIIPILTNGRDRPSFTIIFGWAIETSIFSKNPKAAANYIIRAYREEEDLSSAHTLPPANNQPAPGSHASTTAIPTNQAAARNGNRGGTQPEGTGRGGRGP